eukprot:GFUD01018510.1.p1 GENE.GFUD01018510.1~~GFUD01018510.1.p1  ORF type:complete len:459 (-),score=145.83 GFUD01018510.1:202-1548(-)
MATALTADQLSHQLNALKLDMSAKNVQELVSADKVCTEFINLNLPVQSEVLDLCAGSGIVSANIQSRGFINVDALDEDMPTLRNLQSKKLYRNYIWREVSGIGSTGIREESYDVVITAGGFAANAMSPNDITEVLRILKPDGYMIWTMKTAQAEHSTEFGLFEQNLAGLVKTGKCQIVKHENFSDSRTRTRGELYLVKRLAGRFPDYLDRPTSVELQKQIEETLVDSVDPKHTVKFYDAWSDKYDDDLVIVGNYNGYIKCAEAFLKLGLNHSVSILDLAAGTGLLGGEIARHGYTNIDGLDSSLGMLGKAKKQGIFKNYIHATVDRFGSIPVNDDSYDAIVSSNGFAPGQIYPESLQEMLRVLRPGGYIFIAMKDGYQAQSHRFAMMDTKINDLCQQKQMELTIGPVVFKHFMLNSDGRFYMLRKPTSHSWAVGSPHNSPRQARKAFL